MKERIDRALELAERLVLAIEKLADAAETANPKEPAAPEPEPPKVRPKLTAKGARAVERLLTKVG